MECTRKRLLDTIDTVVVVVVVVATISMIYFLLVCHPIVRTGFHQGVKQYRVTEKNNKSLISRYLRNEIYKNSKIV